jgi:hypothetical protein
VRTKPDELEDEERFGPTSGVLIGWIGLALCAAGLVASVRVDHSADGVGRALAVALLGVLIWCYMLRPRVVIRRSTLVLRNAISEWHVPLASVQTVVVRAVTRVKTADGRYDGVAVGRPVRKMIRDSSSQPRGPASRPLQKGPSHGDVIPDFVVERIAHASDHAREFGQPAGPASRAWAAPEIALMLVLAVGMVIAFVI